MLASADSSLLERVAVLRNGGVSQDQVVKMLTAHPQVHDTRTFHPVRHWALLVQWIIHAECLYKGSHCPISV